MTSTTSTPVTTHGEVFSRRATGLVRLGTPWRVLVLNFANIGLTYIWFTYWITPGRVPSEQPVPQPRGRGSRHRGLRGSARRVLLLVRPLGRRVRLREPDAASRDRVRMQRRDGAVAMLLDRDRRLLDRQPRSGARAGRVQRLDR